MYHVTSFFKSIDFSTGAVTEYFVVPYMCTLKSVSGIVQADPGDAQTITVTSGAAVGTATTALGVLTFGSSIAAGAQGSWAKNATTGDTKLKEGDILKFVTSAGAAAKCDLMINFDENASIPSAAL